LRDNGQVTGQIRPAAPASRQLAADVALAAAVTVASFAVVALIARMPTGGTQGPVAVSAVSGNEWRHGALLVLAARAAPLAVRRLRPLTAFWLCLAACLLPVANVPDGALVSFIALVPAVYSAVAYSRYRGAALLSLPAAVLILAFPGAFPGGYLLLAAVLLCIPVAMAGNAMRRWRQQAAQTQARLDRLRAEHEEATREAVGLERSRIASELHDVVTHNVSMMVVQAGAARRVLGGSPGEAWSALVAIEESGRAAIVELQHLLGLLAPQEEGGRDDPPGAEPRPPQPGLDRLPSLIQRASAAGLPVELRVTGAARPLPPGLDLAAYRVIQEAVTNVIKHSGLSRTTITIEYQAEGLTIEVADDGTSAPPGPAQGTGRGLVGLRERVSLYGGELEAGRRPGGGWRIRARIPDPAALALGPARS